MTILKALDQATQILEKNKLPTSALDAEILLSKVMKKPREWLWAYPQFPITPGQSQKFQNLIKRRERQEPIAYLTGEKEFYKLKFKINKDVLIPRPETELMVDLVKDQVLERPAIICDIGTGSGCLAIVLAKILNQVEPQGQSPWPLPFRGTEPPEAEECTHSPTGRSRGLLRRRAKIYATDISAAALSVARQNTRLHGLQKRIEFFQGHLLSALPVKIFRSPLPKNILANLPYLDRQLLNSSPSIKFEPRLALNGGIDGLESYRELFSQLKLIIADRQSMITVLVEINPSQKRMISRMIIAHFPRAKIRIKKDLGGLNRIVIVRLR